MPASSPSLEFARDGHRINRSLGSITSRATSSDVLSTRGVTNPGSRSISLLFAPPAPQTALEPGNDLEYAFTQRDHHGPHRKRTGRTLLIWICARLGLAVAVLVWVVYCTVRYYTAVQLYADDSVRSRFALGMAIVSTITIIFFASESVTMFGFLRDHLARRLKVTIHSLAYISSFFILSLAIINLVLVILWRTPRDSTQFDRSIQGRCHWDLDVVWSDAGMACEWPHATHFGDWLGAAIFRLLVSALLLVAYHLAVHQYSTVFAGRRKYTAEDPDMEERVVRRPTMSSVPTVGDPREARRPPPGPLPATPHNVITLSEDEHQRRSLSFTVAGQVLSRIEGSELPSEEDGERNSFSSSSSAEYHPSAVVFPGTGNGAFAYFRSESPQPISPDQAFEALAQPNGAPYHPEAGSLPPNPPPSSYYRHIASPSNDLQGFASAFRTLVSRITRETQEGMALHGEAGPPPPREGRRTVRVLGGYISRMSTIDSMASREAGGSARGPSRCETPQSRGSGSGSGSGSRDLSRNATANSRCPDRENASATPVSVTPTPPTTCSSDG